MIVLRSEREISKMHAAGLLVWEAHQRVTELVAPGVTTGELDAVVDELFAQRNAKPLFKGVPGPVPFPAATCISINEEVVHGIPGDRPLQAGRHCQYRHRLPSKWLVRRRRSHAPGG